MVSGSPMEVAAKRTLTGVILNGRPPVPVRPRARAAANPAMMRSEMNSRSYSVSSDDAEDELAGCGGGVDRRALPGQNFQPDATGGEVSDDGDQAAQVPAEPAQLPHHHGVTIAQPLQSGRQLRAVVLLPGCPIFVHPLRIDASRDQGRRVAGRWSGTRGPARPTTRGSTSRAAGANRSRSWVGRTTRSCANMALPPGDRDVAGLREVERDPRYLLVAAGPGSRRHGTQQPVPRSAHLRGQPEPRPQLHQGVSVDEPANVGESAFGEHNLVQLDLLGFCGEGELSSWSPARGVDVQRQPHAARRLSVQHRQVVGNCYWALPPATPPRSVLLIAASSRNSVAHSTDTSCRCLTLGSATLLVVAG